ncbi:MAG TPA: hypothetical protein PKD33_15350 [Rhodocyclaceae bacterium]|nr:hypothetical protein [Rhodocyclaceae bacterium]
MSDPVPATPPVVSPPSPVIVFDTMTYNVIEGPDDSSPLVQAAHAQILQTLEIDKLVRNLNRTDDLLHIAACGVAGFLNPESGKSLSAQVMNLQYKLRDKTGEMSSALLSFGEAAGRMIPILRGAFKDLYGFYEADCVGRLTGCEAVATSMATTAENLKSTFRGLADEAQKIAEDTTQTRDLRRKAKEAAQARQKEIKADLEEKERLKASLAEQIPQVKGWYEEAKAAQNTADGRMFALAIVGSITKALGDGLAAGLQFKTAPVTAGTQLATAIVKNTAVKEPDEKNKKTDDKAKATSETLTAQAAYRVAKDALDQAEAKLTAAQTATKTAQGKLDKLEEPYIEARDAYEAARKKKPKDKKDEAAKKEAFEELEEPYKEAEDAVEDAEAAEEAAQKAVDAAKVKESTAKAVMEDAAAKAPLAGVAEGLRSAGASAQEMGASYADIAANYAKEKAKYLDMLMDLQKQEREALGAIAKFAVQMQTEKDTEQLEQAAVESLHIAVGVLKYVVVILQDVCQFWTQMAAACRRLASADLRTDIEVYMRRSKEERVKEYSAEDFKLRMLAVAAQWRALKRVATEYRAATMQVFDKLGVTYRDNLPIEQARAEAKRLAQLLDKDVKDEIKKTDDATQQIAAAKAEADKLIAKAAAA